MPDYLYPSFGGLSNELTQYEKSRAVVIPVPYEASSSHMPGTMKGPAAIIAASRYLEWYDLEMDFEPYRVGIHTLPEVHLCKDSIKEALAELKDLVAGVLRDGKFPVVLGGEHTLSIGAVQAIVQEYRETSVLCLDAHADMRDRYDGTQYSHACTSRRLRDMCPVLQVGVRSMSLEEAQYIKEKGISDIAYARDVKRLDVAQVLSRLTDKVYVSVDLDVINTGEMPAVGAPEPGGITWCELLDILAICFKSKEVVGCDVVELSPLPGNFAADFLAASLVYKLIAYQFRQEASRR